MNDEQDRALDTLVKLETAATPLAAARIAEVSAYLRRLARDREQLLSRIRALETRSMEMPALKTTPATGPISREARMLAADLGEDLPEEPAPESEDLMTLLTTLGAQPHADAKAAPADDDQLGTSVLPGNDVIEGAMPGAEAILPRYRTLLRPLLNALHDETGIGTRARTRVDELINLIDALERLNTLRRGLLVVHPIVFQPAELLRQSKRTMAARAAAKDQKLMIDAETDAPPVLADGDLSQEVLDALVDNAIRYTDYGGEIRVSAESVGEEVLFTVSDNGIGLEPGDIDRIGTAFFRATHPLVQAHHGAGLRLFIARHLLDTQSGELMFSGEPGLGASFSFTLPAADQ
jgi:signal transduction histidine kinase